MTGTILSQNSFPTRSGMMHIGGARRFGGHGVVHAHNPRTGEILQPPYGHGDRTDVKDAADAAANAFPHFRRLTGADRGQFLQSIAARLEVIADALVDCAGAETGITEVRVRGELARTTGQLRMFADLCREQTGVDVRIDSADPHRQPTPKPEIRQRRVPLGPVAVFGASNFPLAFSVAGGDTASALAAGCPVIVKAHDSHPGTSELVADAICAAIAENGLEPGVFSMLYGSPAEVAVPLVSDPRIKAVAFTGSRQGGLALCAAAAARPVPVPVYAEMSSINPVFLFPNALEQDTDRLAREFVQSLTFGAGQLCTNPGLVFAVTSPALQAFLDQVNDILADNPAAPMLNKNIHANYHGGVTRLRNLGAEEVATGPPDNSIAYSSSAHVFHTTLASFNQNPGLGDEVFGATSLIVSCNNVSDFVPAASALEGQLTATMAVTTDDYAAAADLLPAIEDRAGRVIFNGWPTGVEVCSAMVHGGPYPATSDVRTTSVGASAIDRFLRPVAYQDAPHELCPLHPS